MQRIPHLDRHFAAGRRYLVIAGDEAFILGEHGALRRKDGPSFAAFTVMDLERAFTKFQAVSEEFQDPFSVAQVASLTGDSYYIVYRHLEEVLQSGCRRFTTAEAFALTVASSLRRRNVSAAAVRQVASLIVGAEIPAPEATP